MPYAKIDVGFIREHFINVPEKDRAAAIALYVDLVSISAEMLLDGRLARGVVEAGAQEIGLSRGRYSQRESQRIVHSLVDSGLAELQENNMLQLTYWRDHHQSREYVDGRRKADADRKRGAREQLTMPTTTQDVHSGRPQPVRSGHTPDSRAHARTRAAKEEEKEDLTAAAAVTTHDPEPDLAPDLAAAALIAKLDDLGLNGNAQQLAQADPARAQAWIDLAAHEAKTNPAAFVLTGLRSGEWPSTRQRPPEPGADAPARRERFVLGDGWRLPADELEYQLETMGAEIDEVVELLELAANLRSADQ